MGGRRRKSAKKTRRGRKLRGGAMYSFNQGTPIAVGAAAVGGVNNTQFVNSATGEPIPNDAAKVGGRRKTRKASKKSRKSRRKSMRGGASQVSMGGTYASFQGSGSRGIADYAQGVKPGNPI